MTNSGTSEFTIVDGTNIYVDDAAQIWAKATAKRDGELDVAPLSLSRPIIESALNSSRDPLLLVAIDRTDKPVGMALITPDSASQNHALLRYFAVSPSAWGLGVGKALIQGTTAELLARGFKSAWLEVYESNRSAIGLYQDHGWHVSKETPVHNKTGKRLLTFILELSESSADGL